MLAGIEGRGECWQGLKDADSVGRDWRTQIVLAGIGGHR